MGVFNMEFRSHFFYLVIIVGLFGCDNGTKTNGTVDTKDIAFSDIYNNDISSVKSNEMLGLVLGDRLDKIFKKYPDIDFHHSTNNKKKEACGAINLRGFEPERKLYINLYDHQIVSISVIQKFEANTDIKSMMDEFIKIHGKTSDMDSLRGGKELYAYYNRRSKSSPNFGIEITGNSSQKVSSSRLQYELRMQVHDGKWQSLYDKSDNCVAKVEWPLIGECVEFKNVGAGFLNKGNEIITSGRVTMKPSSSSAYVFISDIDGADKLNIDGKNFYKNEEIKVPISQLSQCR